MTREDSIIESAKVLVAQEKEVINDFIYELASLGRDEEGYEIKGNTREELKQSLQEAFNKMKEI